MKKLLTNILLSDTLLPALFQLQAGNIVGDWNTLASTTIVANGGKASVASRVWFYYTFIPVYDAVNAIHRMYQPFYYNGLAPAGASDEAAAVAAAHRVLVNYFPAEQPDLDAAFTKSLNGIIAPAQAKTDGVATGETAAAALISERANDGLEANVPYTAGNSPGGWQPTPPGFLAALTPWLGQMRPFTMKGADQFLPDAPMPLTSERWVAEYSLTRLFGDTNSTVRTPAQGEISLFWAVHTGQQYSRAPELSVGRDGFAAAPGNPLDWLTPGTSAGFDCELPEGGTVSGKATASSLLGGLLPPYKETEAV